MTSGVFRATDEALATGQMQFVHDTEFESWLTNQRIKHTDLYQTFMNLNTAEVTQDHFVETVIEAALSYGFHAGVTYCTINDNTREHHL